MYKTKKGKKKKGKKVAMKPGEMFNKFQSKKKKMTDNSRSAETVVKAEQNASHKFKGRGARKV